MQGSVLDNDVGRDDSAQAHSANNPSRDLEEPSLEHISGRVEFSNFVFEALGNVELAVDKGWLARFC